MLLTFLLMRYFTSTYYPFCPRYSYSLSSWCSTLLSFLYFTYFLAHAQLYSYKYSELFNYFCCCWCLVAFFPNLYILAMFQFAILSSNFKLFSWYSTLPSLFPAYKYYILLYCLSIMLISCLADVPLCCPVHSALSLPSASDNNPTFHCILRQAQVSWYTS